MTNRIARRTPAWATLALLALSLPGCAPAPPVRREAPPVAVEEPEPADLMRESPVPDGPWRPHLLSRCRGEDAAPPAVERALSAAYELFRYKAGSDAIMELEICLRNHPADGLLLLTLGQLYLMGGQGEPELLPREGPAADVGNWPRNRTRLLARAQKLLEDARHARPDDGAPDFLLADVERARGDSVAAAAALAAGLEKCSRTRSLEILRRYQSLKGRGPRPLGTIAPAYPPEAAQAGASGEVVSDLLISPAGLVAQVVTVASPDPRLTRAASTALRRTAFEPARLGKYPIWSWLRIPTQFTLRG